MCDIAMSTNFPASVLPADSGHYMRTCFTRNADRQQYLSVCRMAVLNDFEACGYGVPALQPEDLLVLNDVPARQKVCADCC